MITPLRGWLSALCGLMLIALSVNAAAAETRVALVVGNSAYKNTSLNLNNPKNDAQDVAAALRTLGFEVIVAVDATKRDLDLAMTQFGRAATNADAALFFYAGHAIQYQGRNYLLPVDADLEDEVSLRFQTTSLDDVRAAVERASGVKIMILDACRNNPIVDTLKRRMMGMNRGLDLTRGLARIDRAEGIIVAYATAADEVAADGQGRNSPFSAALIKHLQEPGLEIAKMFRRIAADVVETTHGRQRPEIYVSLIDEYYINQKDRAAWDQIKDKNDPKAFHDFVVSFPSSPRVSDAQYRLDMLERLSRERQAEKDRLEQDAIKARQAEAERQAAEAAKQEAARQLAAKEAAKQQAAKDAAQQEAARQEAAKQAEAAKQEAARQQAAKAAAKQEAARQQAAQEAARQEAAKQEETAKREAARLAMLERDKTERETAEREAAQRRHDEEQRSQAAVEHEKQARLTTGPAQQPTTEPKTLPEASQEQICRHDEERLTKLRAKPVSDEIDRFERELGCAKLRPQIARLRESVNMVEAYADTNAAPPAQPPQASPESPRVPAEPVRPQAISNQQNAAPTSSSEPNCKGDEERLAKLRANPVVDEIVRFERELSCAKLRPQIVRLRESIADGAPKAESVFPHRRSRNRGAMSNLPRSVAPAPSSSPEVCKRDGEKLAQLRANPARDEIARFERELGCTKLRPQVVRLRESLSAN